MAKPMAFLMAWNTRHVPSAFIHENELELFRRGFDTADIALAKGCSEAEVYSMVHHLRAHERRSRRVG